MEELLLEQVGTLRWTAYPESNADARIFREVTSMILERPNSAHDLMRFLPLGWRLGIGYPSSSAYARDKEVRLVTPSTAEWFATALHEFGHVDDYQKPDFSLDEVDYLYWSYQTYDPGINPSVLRRVFAFESRAWEWALRKAKEMDLPDQVIKMFHDTIQNRKFLGGYVRGITTGYRLEQAARNGGMNKEDLRDELLWIYEEWLRRNE